MSQPRLLQTLLQGSAVRLFRTGRQQHRELAAPEKLNRAAPPALIEQLKEGGRLVLPLGPQESQFLTVIDKHPGGTLEARKLIAVRFTQLETV